jgi:hypothetical protein
VVVDVDVVGADVVLVAVTDDVAFTDPAGLPHADRVTATSTATPMPTAPAPRPPVRTRRNAATA